jgi:hypothetical protein
MTNNIRTVSISAGIVMIIALLIGGTPQSEASIIVNDIRRTVGAHAEYATTSLAADKDGILTEFTNLGGWNESASAAVDFSSAFAEQNSTVAFGKDNSLIIGGAFHASGQSNPSTWMMASNSAESTLTLSFTLDRTRSALLFAQAAASRSGSANSEDLSLIRLTRNGDAEPLLTIDLGFGEDGETENTMFFGMPELEAGQYELEVLVKTDQWGFDSQPMIFDQWIDLEFQMVIVPAPSAIAVLALAGIVGPRRRRESAR